MTAIGCFRSSRDGRSESAFTSLPIMLVTGSDPSLIGAADAVEEILALSNVVKLQDAPGLGDVVEFLCCFGGFASN